MNINDTLRAVRDFGDENKTIRRDTGASFGRDDCRVGAVCANCFVGREISIAMRADEKVSFGADDFSVFSSFLAHAGGTNAIANSGPLRAAVVAEFVELDTFVRPDGVVGVGVGGKQDAVHDATAGSVFTTVTFSCCCLSIDESATSAKLVAVFKNFNNFVLLLSVATAVVRQRCNDDDKDDEEKIFHFFFFFKQRRTGETLFFEKMIHSKNSAEREREKRENFLK